MKRLALGVVALACPLILVAFWLQGVAGAVVLAAAAGALPVALITLGAARGGGLGRPLAWSLAGLLLLLEGCLLGILVLRGQVMEAPWVGGLPLAAALQLYGIGLLPTALVVLAYALTFHRHGLAREDLARLRERVGGTAGGGQGTAGAPGTTPGDPAGTSATSGTTTRPPPERQGRPEPRGRS